MFAAMPSRNCNANNDQLVYLFTVIEANNVTFDFNVRIFSSLSKYNFLPTNVP